MTIESSHLKNVPGGAPIAGSFSVQYQLGHAGQTLSFSGYIMEGEHLDEINVKVDILMLAAERQRARAELPALESKMADLQRTIEQTERAHNLLSDPSHKRTTAETQALTQYDTNIAHLKHELVKALRAIEDLKEKAR